MVRFLEVLVKSLNFTHTCLYEPCNYKLREGAVQSAQASLQLCCLHAIKSGFLVSSLYCFCFISYRWLQQMSFRFWLCLMVLYILQIFTIVVFFRNVGDDITQDVSKGWSSETVCTKYKKSRMSCSYQPALNINMQDIVEIHLSHDVWD